MDKKMMWWLAYLLIMIIATISAEYFFYGSFNLAYLLGVIVGTSLGWLIINSPKKPWVYWLSMLSWIVLIPGATLGFVRYIASLLSIKITIYGYVVIYLLGAMLMILFYIRTWSRAKVQEIVNRPVVDERYQLHFGTASFWSFLFINFLMIGALLQPWIPYSQPGLWIGVMIAGTVFWVIYLGILERIN
jgi:hypothetical protein